MAGPEEPGPVPEQSPDRQTRFRRGYGAGPLHLVGLLLSFALAGYVTSQIAAGPGATRIAVWFVGAVIAHDLLLWPLYAVADRFAVDLRRRRPRPRPVNWINHLRVPAVLSGVLLVISFPLVFNWSGRTYQAATGLSPSPYTARWLAVTTALFAISAVAYAARLGWAFGHGRRGRADRQP